MNKEDNKKNRKEIRYLLEQVNWLIKLRWMACVGVFCTIFVADHFTGVTISTAQLYLVSAVLVVYNSILSLIIRRRKYKLFRTPKAISTLTVFQISFDLTILTALIHFSGGAENPFIFYYIFHMIIGSIMLLRRCAFIQATYAIILFLSVIFLEYSGILRHHCLYGIPEYSLHNNAIYIIGLAIAFITTIYTSVYMASSISGKLKEREKNLAQAIELLNEKDKIKDTYVLRVTHDIKEDLAAIHSCIEPVTDGITGTLNEKQDSLLQRAKSRSKRLVNFVNDLLDVTKMKLTKKLQKSEFLLPELIREVSEHIAARANSNNILFETKVAPDIKTMNGVRSTIREALLNLLTNSVKYTPDGGQIFLEVTEKDGKLLIAIKDTGIGIPESDLPYIFEEFYRAKNTVSQAGHSSGLGLSIVKQIVDMHSGEIKVKSQQGKGTTFLLEFPK